MTSPDLLAELRECAHAMAEAARGVTLGLFRAPELTTANKLTDGFDPVTQADQQAEAAMRAVLAARRPMDGIIGEEAGNTTGTSGLTWVLDPIDGTRAFIAGTPTWGTLIAVQDANGPILGLIDQPHIGEVFEGVPDGAFLHHRASSRAIVTRATQSLSEATLLTTFPEVGTAAERRAFEAVSGQVRLTRYGLDCYGYALLALGHVDLVIEAGLNAYDIAAPVAVVQAADGVVTTWDGGPAHHGGRVIAAANPAIHTAALEILQNAR